MMPLIDPIPFVDALGRALLHFVWEGALVGLVYAVVRPACKTVEGRYRLGMAALVLMMGALLSTFAWVRPDARIAASGEFAAMPAAAVVADAGTTPWFVATQWESALPWLVAFWLLGVGLIATRSFLHWRRLARVALTAISLSRDWQLRLIQMQKKFGVLRPVRLLSSIHVATPTLIGWLKPAILLPASLLSGFTPAQIELIVAHELSHVRRFDYLANLAQVVIETLLFYHPVVYWISRDVRQSRESCCDDLVLTLGGGDAIAYARTLADLEEMQQDFGPAVPALGAGGGLLFARIRRLVDPTYASAQDALPRGHGVVLPVMLACAGLGIALLRMHLVPATLVAALTPSIEWNASRSLAIVVPTSALTVQLAAAIAPVPAVHHAPSDAAQLMPAVFSDAPLRPAVASASPLAVTAMGFTDRVELTASRVAPPLPRTVAPVESKTSSVPIPAAAERTASVPEPSEVVPARYPIDALRDGVTGKVDLDFRIAPDGSVRDVRVIRAHPTGVFEQAAVAALRRWHFDVGANVDPNHRYGRSFAFARAHAGQETCHEVTGSHICRHQAAE